MAQAYDLRYVTQWSTATTDFLIQEGEDRFIPFETPTFFPKDVDTRMFDHSGRAYHITDAVIEQRVIMKVGTITPVGRTSDAELSPFYDNDSYARPVHQRGRKAVAPVYAQDGTIKDDAKRPVPEKWFVNDYHYEHDWIARDQDGMIVLHNGVRIRCADTGVYVDAIGNAYHEIRRI